MFDRNHAKNVFCNNINTNILKIMELFRDIEDIC